MALNFGKLDFSVSFNRTSAFPLDSKSYFETLAAAQAAAATAIEAGGSDSSYYFGQTLVVVENGVATMYVIQPDKSLTEVGGKVTVNEKVFSTDPDGKLDLLGFSTAVAGAQAVKGADGSITWVKPDQTTVEGLQTTVAALQEAIGSKENGTGLAGDVKKLEDAVGAPAAGETAATGIFKALDEKADKSTVYTKKDADAAIAAAVSKADHLKRKIVDSTADIDLTAADASQYIYMVKKGTSVTGDTYDEYMVINGALEKVGDWGVDLSDYVKTEVFNTELGKKVDKVEGSRLMTEAEGTKLAAIAEGAEKNFIKAVETTEFAVGAEDGKLSLVAVAQDKVTGLADTLATKVDKVDGSRLMTEEEGKKIAALQSDETGKVTLPAANVNGLTELLATKVDKEAGKTLTSNDFTDELLEKLNGISAGANANVIEKVQIGDTALPIVEKAVTLPGATADQLGLVKSSVDENKVAVAEDGTMEVNSVNVNKLAQTEGDELILNGGNATV